jgi:hypothetical protein
MIVYVGYDKPADRGGRVCAWLDKAKRQGPYELPNLLDEGGLDWGMIPGSTKIARPGSKALAMALCAAVVDRPQALRMHQLFQFRHVNSLPPNSRWTIEHSQLRAWVTRLAADMGENELLVARAPRERVQFERETGLGAHGVPVRWDSDDEGKTIPATDPDDMTWSPAPHRRG